MANLEHTAVWSEILRDKDTLPLKALAERHGTTPGAISAAFKRTGTRRAPAGAALPPEPGEAPKTSRRVRPGSKDGLIEAHRHLLGNVPDAEVAKMAGVSVRTVASYRARHDISGYRGPRRSTSRRGPRRSRIDPYVDLLGKVPDRVVAEKAKVSLNAVRNYRVKRGIPAAGRERPAAGPAVSSGVQAIATAGQKAWRVVWVEAGAEVARIVLAEDLDRVVARIKEARLEDNIVRISLEGALLDR